MSPPEPPPPEVLRAQLRIVDIPAGTEVVRIFNRQFSSLSFNPTDSSSRFRPIMGSASGPVIPTAYIAQDFETAVHEVLLRGIDVLRMREFPRLYWKDVENMSAVTLRFLKDVKLARFHGAGLTSLKLLPEQITGGDARQYPFTARWAKAVFDVDDETAGIEWVSLQNQSGRAQILWSADGRIKSPEDWLEPVGKRLDLDEGQGLAELHTLCDYAGFEFSGRPNRTDTPRVVRSGRI